MEKENSKLVSTWEMLYKDNDGEGHIETLHKYEYPDQPVDIDHFLSQAAPIKITSPKSRSIKRESRLLADIPDIHYGIRRLPDGELQPTHSPEVMDKSLQIIRDQQPDVIILGGDIIDAPTVGKYELDSLHFIDTLQLSIDGLYKYLARLRADNPNARIINTKGNHDHRFEKYVMRNAKPLFGIKRANMPEEFAANTLPFLLRLDELEIEQTTAPYMVNEYLMTQHGELSVNGGSTAHRYLGRLATSLMFHHSHRREAARKVFPDGYAIEAFSFGCQADVAGSVPSVHNKVDDRGFVVEKYENWNNGMGFVEYTDDKFKQIPVPIEVQDDYDASYAGRVYEARQDVIEAFKNGC